MDYTTQYHYTKEVLEETAQFCLFWDQNQIKLSARIERILTLERDLYLQYMFINLAPSPLSPTKELIERWLIPAKNFEIYNIRVEILRRLFEFTKNNIFDYPKTTIHFPNLKELIFWRKYHNSIFNQTREIFNRISTQDIVRSELACWPFYDSMKIYRDHQKTVAEPVNFFLESHALICKMLTQRFDTRKELKILDIGCGDGKLLMYIRENFPQAKLYATNFFADVGVNQKLLTDPKFTLKVCTLEDMDFAPDFFDVIVSTEVIEHLKNPIEMIIQIKKHLKQDGFFIVTAPSVHTRFLSPNPLTYLAGLISTFYEKYLPPFHNLYEGLTDLPLVHYAFSHQQFSRMFGQYFSNYNVTTSRFTHLRKFRLHNIAHKIPFLSHFGGLVMAYGKK